MAIITRDQIPDLLLPVLHMVYGEYLYYQDDWSQMFDIYTSKRATEFTQQMKYLPMASFKTEAGPVQSAIMGQAYQKTPFNHRWVGISYTMTRSAIEDNLYNDQWPMGTMTGRESLGQLKNVLGSAVLNNGFNPTVLGPDQQPLFSINHPSDSGPWANTLSVASDLNETALEDIIIVGQKMLDAAGLLKKIKPKKMFVSPENQFNAERILESKYRTGTGDNDINAVYNTSAVPQGFAINHYLIGKSWYIRNDIPGLKHFTRDEVDIDMFADPLSGNLTSIFMERYSFGFDEARAALGVQAF